MTEDEQKKKAEELKEKGLCLCPDDKKCEYDLHCEECPYYAHSPGRQVVS